MPDLGPYRPLLHSVFFLYGSPDDAYEGHPNGATGFFFEMPFANGMPFHHIYGVTNWHAAIECEMTYARVNKTDGHFEIFESKPDEWFYLPAKYDIAVVPFNVNQHTHHAVYIPGVMALNAAKTESFGIGEGEDVFMIGRFIDYHGEETNSPAMRFGHISIMSAEIEQPTGYSGRSIVLDMNSRTGFSGSPVFVYRTTGSQFLKHDPTNMAQSEFPTGHMMQFLGIHWGQFPEDWALKKGKAESATTLLTNAKETYVKGLSGMTCVIPADAILEVLNMSELAKRREDVERMAEQQKAASAQKRPEPEAVSPESETPPFA